MQKTQKTLHKLKKTEKQKYFVSLLLNQLLFRPVQPFKMTLSFVKEFYVVGEKMARNGRKMAIYQ